jgi:hypothetical protein
MADAAPRFGVHDTRVARAGIRVSRTLNGNGNGNGNGSTESR